jgi:hypothetical protein
MIDGKTDQKGLDLKCTRRSNEAEVRMKDDAYLQMNDGSEAASPITLEM